MNTSFSKRLVTAMNKEGLNQADLAKLLGISRAAVSRWMIDYPNLSSKMLAELSCYLNVSLNWLLLGTPVMERPVLLELSCQERQILLIINDLEEELKEHFMQMALPLEQKRQSTLKKIRLRSDHIIRDQKLPVVIIDLDGVIIQSNSHYNNYFGAATSGGSLVGRSIYEILPTFFHGSARLDIHRTRINGHSSNFKCAGKRLDTGKELTFTVYARSIETDTRPAILAVLFPDV